MVWGVFVTVGNTYMELAVSGKKKVKGSIETLKRKPNISGYCANIHKAPAVMEVSGQSSRGAVLWCW